MDNRARRRLAAFNARKAREQLAGIHAVTFTYEVDGLGFCLVDRITVDNGADLVRVIALNGDRRGTEYAVPRDSVIVRRTAAGRAIYLR